jgi:hypothetical protein
MIEPEAELEVVDSYLYPHEAYLACSALESAGIDAVIADEHIIAMDWMLAIAVGGIKIRVRAKDLEAAREFLAESAEASRVERNNDREACPRCGGREHMSRVTTGKALALLSWFVAGAPVWPVRRRLHCRDCGYTGIPMRAAEAEAANESVPSGPVGENADDSAPTA